MLASTLVAGNNWAEEAVIIHQFGLRERQLKKTNLSVIPEYSNLSIKLSCG